MSDLAAGLCRRGGTVAVGEFEISHAAAAAPRTSAPNLRLGRRWRADIRT